MMLIDTSDRKRWEEIEKDHKEFYKNVVMYKIQTAIHITNKIIFFHKKSKKIETIRQYNKILKRIEGEKEAFIIYDKVAIDKIIMGFESDASNMIFKITNKTTLLEKELTGINFTYTDKVIASENDIKNTINTSSSAFELENAIKPFINIYNELFVKNIHPMKNGNYFDKREISTYLYNVDSYKEILPENIFNYDNFCSETSETNYNWGRHRLISTMNISVCPYCNRQYVTSYGESDNKKTTADLDHYYPKSKYPYLALSLYNFIPSCQICNSRMKGDKEGHLYPYDDECGDKAIFKTSNNSINGILNSKSSDFEIEFKIQDHKITDKEYKERLEKSKEIFKLEEVYKTSHNQYILDMLHTIEHYPDSYLETITEIFGNKEEEEKKEKLKKELRNLLKKPYEDRIERNDTLAKLTKDILNEYKSL